MKIPYNSTIKPKTNLISIAELEKRSILIPSLLSLTLSACGGSSNLIPVAAPDSSLNVDEDTGPTELGIAAPTDEDVNDTLTIKVDSVPEGGEIRTAAGDLVTAGSSLTIDELTGLTFTPNKDVSSDLQTVGTFSYTVSDQAGGSDSSSVTFEVNPIQDPPSITSVMEFAIDENTTSVGTITGEDPDGDTLSYSITGGADSALFSIDSSTGEVSFIDKPDYEDPKDEDLDNVYSVEITVDDGNGNTASQTILVTVNDMTTSMTLSAQTLNENDAGAAIGSLQTYIDDTSAVGTVTYSVSGTGSENFEVVEGELKVKDGVQLDFESSSSYSLTITASDDGGPSTSFDFTITVNDVNDSPTDISISSIGVPEQLDGATVGTISVSDQDAGDTFTYSISDDRFEIVDGVLKLMAGNTVAYSDEQTITLSITATDAAGSEYTKEFTLLVGSIQISSTSFTENSAGAVVGDLSITDPDFTANITYTLSGDDAANFEVVNGQLKLKDGVSADFETKSSYSVTITAADDASHEATLTYTINVTDENEVPTAVSLSASAINENAAGAVVGDLATTDVDAGDTHTYTLSGADADSFEVVNGQLKLKDSVSANYEGQSTYAVTVTTTDSGDLATSQSFSVTINDVNEAPTVANVVADQSINEDSALSFTVPSNSFNDVDAGDTLTYTATLEDGSALPTWLTFDATTLTFSGTPLNADVGVINVTVTASDGSLSATDTFALTVVNTNDDPTAVSLSASAIDENGDGVVVGDLTTTDVDAGDTHTYTLSGDDAASFEVVDGQLKLKAGVSADYETQSTYAVTVTTTDGLGSTFAQSFSVTINDVNEAPTAITLSASAIDENAAGAVVGTLTTTDVDAGDTVEYALSGTDADSFEVVDGKLQLKSDVSADHETQTSYEVTVTVTDSGGLTAAQDFTVSVNNLNDNNPVFTSDAAINMAENSSSVGTVVATDADGDSLTYSISGGNDAGLFTIDSSTGELTLQAKTNGLSTDSTSLPFKLTNLVDNGDGTYTVDIEVDPSVYSYAAAGGITIELVFDNDKISFNKDNVDITADGGSSKNNTSNGVKIVWYDNSGVNSFTGGKLGTITFTPTAGATDPSITINGSIAGGDLDGIDSTESDSSTVYSWTEVRTDVDYEDAQDSDGDNVYEVTIQVSDGVNSTTQDISVTVTDVEESGREIESDDGNTDIDGIDHPDHVDGDISIPNLSFIDFTISDAVNYSFDSVNITNEEFEVSPNIDYLVDDNINSLDLSGDNNSNIEITINDGLENLSIINNFYEDDYVIHENYFYDNI